MTKHSPRLITSTMKVLAGKAGNEVGLADEILLNLTSIICLNKALHTDLFSKCQSSEALLWHTCFSHGRNNP